MDEAYYDGGYVPLEREPEPEPLRPPLSGRRRVCSLCRTSGVARVVRFENLLTDEIAVGALDLCFLCSDLLASDPVGLGERMDAEQWETFPSGEAVARYLQQRLAEVIDIPAPSPDLQRLLDNGFEPIGELTGAIDFVRVWPAEHRASLRYTNSRTMQDDGRDWLVRSPWPGVPVEDVLPIVLRWVERDALCRDEDIRQVRAAEALTWTEEQALEQRSAR